jgi:hypothetical protein
MVYGLYTRDDGVTDFARLVDADQFQDPARGWRVVGSTVVPLFPILAHPREVRGTSPFTGRRGRTVVANLQAPLWTGAANQFQIETNDPLNPHDTIDVTFRKGERFRHPR